MVADLQLKLVESEKNHQEHIKSKEYPSDIAGEMIV
jgi:hypothetical protein